MTTDMSTEWTFEPYNPTPFYKRLPIRQILINGLIVILAGLFLIPFYLLVRNAWMSDDQITAFHWYWLPMPVRFDNLFEIFGGTGASVASERSKLLLTGLRNSGLISIFQTFGQLIISAMAGYGLARIPYRWRNLVLYFILATLMVPTVVTLIPSFIVIVQLGWLNTLTGVIFPGLFNAFTIFIFRQFYLNFPKEVSEAGMVDGLNHLGIFWHLVLPNSTALLISMGAIAFINSWNAYLWPLLVGQDPSVWTVQVAVSSFLRSDTSGVMHLVFTAGLLAIMPPFILFLILQRYITEGVARTGIKG